MRSTLLLGHSSPSPLRHHLPPTSHLGAANAFPLFMRHPLVFPVQPFSFLLLLAWHVEVHGPEANMAQYSAAKHKSPELFLSSRVCFKGAICNHCTWLYEQSKSHKFGINGYGSQCLLRLAVKYVTHHQQ